MTLGQRDICQSDVSGSAAAMSLTARQAEVLQLAGRLRLTRAARSTPSPASRAPG